MDTTHCQAPPPNRGASLTITFGLVNIPVKVMKGIADVKSVPARSMFTATGNPVGNKKIDKITGHELGDDVIVKMATASDGTTVVELTDEEIDACTEGMTMRGVAEVVAAIDADGWRDCYVPEERSFVVAADQKVGTKRVPNPAAQKGLALLLAALDAERKVALVKYPGRAGAPRYAVITPDGVFHSVAFAGEVRQAPPMPAPPIADKELALGRALVQSMASSEIPVLVDDAGAKIQAYVDAKAAGKAPAVAIVTAEEAPVIDLMAALEASVAAAAPAPAKPAKGRKGRAA